MSKSIQLAKKLKALAERGVGGEKINAEKMLRDLMRKHDISDSDLSSDCRSFMTFKMKVHQRTFYIQIIIFVMGVDTKTYSTRGSRTKVHVECTEMQYIEIAATFNYFWSEYEKDLDVFYSAWIQKNRLIPSDGGYMSEEDVDPKMMEMMKSIDKRSKNKLIG